MLLSPIDALPISLKFTFVFATRLDDSRLRADLESCLVKYWPLRCHLDGLTLVEPLQRPGYIWEQQATLDASLAQVRQDAALIHQLKPVTLAHNRGDPTLILKVTHLSDGCALSVSVSHAVVDAFSVFRQFLAEWSSPGSTGDVSHDRSVMRREGPEVLVPLRCSMLIPARYLAPKVDEEAASSSEPLNRRFTFTRERLLELQRVCGAPSRMQALWSHVWSRVSAQYRSVSFPVNCRGRLGVPAGYFGNALLHGRADLTEAQAEDLSQVSLVDYSAAIAEGLRQDAQEFLLWSSQRVPEDGSQALLPVCGGTTGAAMFDSWANLPLSPEFQGHPGELLWGNHAWPRFLFLFYDAGEEAGALYVQCHRDFQL